MRVGVIREGKRKGEIIIIIINYNLKSKSN